MRVAQSRLGYPVHGWRRNNAAKRAGDPIALVIGHDQQHVRCTFRRHDRGRPIRFGIGCGVLDHTAEFRVGRRQLFAVDGRRGARVNPAFRWSAGRRSNQRQRTRTEADNANARMVGVDFIVSLPRKCFVADTRGGAIYCALFFVSWAFCWSSFSSAEFGRSSLTVSLSSLPVNRNGTW